MVVGWGGGGRGWVGVGMDGGGVGMGGVVVWVVVGWWWVGVGWWGECDGVGWVVVVGCRGMVGGVIRLSF